MTVITQGDLWYHHQALFCAPAVTIGAWDWDPSLVLSPTNENHRRAVRNFYDICRMIDGAEGFAFVPDLAPADLERLRPVTQPATSPESSGGASGALTYRFRYLEGVRCLFRTRDLHQALADTDRFGWVSPRAMLAARLSTIDWIDPGLSIHQLAHRCSGVTAQGDAPLLTLDTVTVDGNWCAHTLLMQVEPALRVPLWATVLDIITGTLTTLAATRPDMSPADLQAWVDFLRSSVDRDAQLLAYLLIHTPDSPVLLAALGQAGARYPVRPASSG